jgi:cyclic beta-1,2-glucan synthetase
VIGGYGVTASVVTPTADTNHYAISQLFAGQSGSIHTAPQSPRFIRTCSRKALSSAKGLLDVQALHAVLSNRLPEDQVLSHDLIEGSMRRCGGVSDVTLLEDAPMHADVARPRHRWTRGDWQLLPVLFSRRNRYGLRTIDRWKLFDNLRRSLVAPFAVALIITALWGGPYRRWRRSHSFVAFGGGPLLGAIAGLAPSRDDVASDIFTGKALANVGRAVSAALWSMVQLLQQSMLLVDAIARAIYRSTVSRRRLVQWTTTAASQAAAAQNLEDIAPSRAGHHRRRCAARHCAAIAHAVANSRDRPMFDMGLRASMDLVGK